MRWYFVEKQIIGSINKDQAAHLASLALQCKMAKRKQQYGENKMTGAFIESEIDFALPLIYHDEKQIGGTTKLEDWIKIIMREHEKR